MQLLVENMEELTSFKTDEEFLRAQYQYKNGNPGRFYSPFTLAKKTHSHTRLQVAENLRNRMLEAFKDNLRIGGGEAQASTVRKEVRSQNLEGF